MSVARRIIIVLTALSISAVLLRPQLSSALLTRGDTLAYWGYRDAARRSYAKALVIDEGNGVAADRLVFASAFAKEAGVIRYGIGVASMYLARHPDDAAVLADRAFCYQHIGEYAMAADDFRRAGTIGRDARAMMFAALDEKRLRHVRTAHALMRTAVAMDPRFSPSSRALSGYRL